MPRKNSDLPGPAGPNYTSLVRYGAAFLLGAIVTLSFSPYNLYLLAVLSPAGLVYLWRRMGPKTAFLTGYLYGLGMFGFGISWLHISINLFGGVNFAGSVLLTFLFVAFIALFPALAGAFSAALTARLPPAAALAGIPAIWVLCEWIRSWIFTGFPWLNLGYSQTDSLLAGLAPLAGVFGISLALMLSASYIAIMPELQLRRRLAAGIALLVIWSAGWLSADTAWTDPAGGILSVALIQGAVPQELKWQPLMRESTLDLYGELSAPHLDADLIIWPEAAVPAYYHEVEDYFRELQALTREHGVTLLTGIPIKDEQTGAYYNSVVMLDDEVSFYHKRHLVPFGEYLPLEFLLGGIVNYLNIPMSSFSPGADMDPVMGGMELKIGISICYEDTFGEEVIEALPEARVLVNVSNDAWFGNSAAPHQHLQMARMRAAETGRYLLRATNTGVTAIIDEKGRVLDQSRQFVPTSLAGEAVLFQGHTPYSRFGNHPVIILCLLLSAGVWVRGRLKEKTLDRINRIFTGFTG